MSADNWTNCPSCERKDCFREDYEIGMWQGIFELSYSGKCTECNFIYRFTHKDREPINTAAQFQESEK